MSAPTQELCPDCGAQLPVVDGPTHRYIGASPACWALFAALVNGGEPPLAPGPYNALITDAYAVQHPGTPSPQAIQSVAVHLLTLYGVMVKGNDAAQALWTRQRALREETGSKRDRFVWLEPPVPNGALTIADIVVAATPEARRDLAQRYVTSVWASWAAHLPTVAAWYARYVEAARL